MATTETRQSYRLLILATLICTGTLLLAGLVNRLHHAHLPVNTYLTVHTVFEVFSIIVSFTVFVVGWFGYKRNANRQNLFIGLVFLAVGLIDFAHTLSYRGMPAFLTANSVSKASTLWIAARLVNSIGLLAAAFVAPRSERRWPDVSVLLVTTIAFTTALILAILYIPGINALMYTPGVGQTGLKIGLEWLVITLYAGAALAFGIRRPSEQKVALLQAALIVSIFSELSFTLYVSAFDVFNLTGHILKIAAYYLIFRALFVSAFERPYDELSRALRRLEHSFSQVGSALASSLELDKVLSLIASLASDILGSDLAAVMLRSNAQLSIRAQAGLPARREDLTMDHTAAMLAITSGKPVVVGDIRELCERKETCYQYYLETQLHVKSAVAAPIVSGTDILGAIEVYSTERQAFDSGDADLLSGFARQAAVAIRNSMAYQSERAVAETLQRSLLPVPPDIKGLDIAVRYEPAGETDRIGGDLYDIFQRDADHVVLVVGDVSGHGLQAASVMASTLYTLRGLLMQGSSPAAAVQAANLNLVRREADDPAGLMFATIFAGVLDLRTQTISYANAGHHTPLLLGNGCRLDEIASNAPIGIDESTVYETHEWNLGDARGILLYTDGVVEARRNRRDLFGHDRLLGVCREVDGAGANALIERVVDDARDWAGELQDDIALLAVLWDGRKDQAQ